ncbi:hypothetical protein BDV25DRAFT_139576 [Aspergillus avenaceus]|uniref:Sodium/calcium exchanger membrane region domain-containing protein n=1 Tax=Aspergillus avenaceus TaxID=36643 RepID=A0A5N6TWP0_ASPAV|nr:hypothetical protein BDV25DRAFT_139576 [Aspergillus avenaceus]
MAASISYALSVVLYHASSDDDPRKYENNQTLSHGTAIASLCLYALLIWFRSSTHTHLFESRDLDGSDRSDLDDDTSSSEGSPVSLYAAGLVAILSITGLTACINVLASCTDSAAEATNLSKRYIGLILLPMISNIPRSLQTVALAWGGNMDGVIRLTLGSRLHLALFAWPVLIIASWAFSITMPVDQAMIEPVVLFLACLIIALVTQDGKSNYLDGFLALGMYTAIHLAIYVSPDYASDP